MKVKPLPAYSMQAKDNHYEIHADGKALKTPAGAALAVPQADLAQAVLKEWQAQSDKINPATMPFTQLTCTAIDITGKERGKIIDQLLGYASSELLCHRAEEPPELIKQQQKIWQPILDWCATHFKASLKTDRGIMPIDQSPEALKNLRRAIETYDAFSLTGLQQAVDVSGSLVLGLALAERHMNAAQIFEAAELDALFQMQKWGEDPATTKRHETIKHDLAVCEQWFVLLGQSR